MAAIEGVRTSIRVPGALSRTVIVSILLHSSVALAKTAPVGKPVEPSEDEKAAMARLSGKLNALIVWSTSRVSGKHDIFIMKGDGSDKKALTKSNNVDWFPRFSPDGKRVLFVRSKMSWVSEANAFRNEWWDLFVVNADGAGEKKIVKDACWGEWNRDGKSIVFARGHQAFSMDLETGEEKLLLDGQTALKGAILQQPGPSPDGRYLAITLRGRRRETGVWDLAAKTWAQVGMSGGGCQIGWFPSGDRVYWVSPNPSADGGSELLSAEVKDGKPVDPRAKYVDWRWVDLPGRRSHEYFPKVSNDGKWLVWCATIYGHDHDIYDYEVFCWRIGTPIQEAVRLTFHDGNDRWPDIYVLGGEESR